MTYSRVLGTIGLIGATVLGATGPLRASSVAHASAIAIKHRIDLTAKLSPAAAKAAALQALRQGSFKTANGKTVYLSSALVNRFSAASGKGSTAHASGAASASVPPTINGGIRANQDFGFYSNGNGALFHNTESVAVDPTTPPHLVVSATDSSLGYAGSILNQSSNPIFNATFNPNCFSGPTDTGLLGLSPCSLEIGALGGPGVYDSTDGAGHFTGLIIPDTLTGSPPNAINTAAPAGVIAGVSIFTLPPVTGVSTGVVSPTVTIPATVGCIPESGVFSVPGAGVPNGCIPYDAVGDQSVAFDTTGNLYSLSLGIVSDVTLNGTGSTSTVLGGVGFFNGLPQTDLLLNVSPAVQPVGMLANGGLTQPGLAAGRVFNAMAPSGASATTTACNPQQASTVLCLHDEVIASNLPSNQFPNSQFSGSTIISQTPANQIGRNFQADDAFGGGNGECGALNSDGDTSPEVCFIDQPYLAINGILDDVAIATYTLFNFSDLTSGIFYTSASVGGSNIGGTLPVWTVPQPLDNPANLTFGNPACTENSTTDTNGNTFTFCTDSWGAEPTIGPDGQVYVAYENGDIAKPSTVPSGNPLSPIVSANQILVATLVPVVAGKALETVNGTQFVSEVFDHDAYEAAVATPPNPYNADPAGLDPASGAYFTIPNRPTIAVTGATTVVGATTLSVPSGVVIVAWTDQRSMPGSLTAPVFTNGTRIWYSLGVKPATKPLAFSLLSGNTGVPTLTTNQLVNSTTLVAPGPYFIREVSEPTTAGTPIVNQFFPWVTAAQLNTSATGSGSNSPDPIFLGYYQETPGSTGSPFGTSSSATLTFNVAKSTDFGLTFGIGTVPYAMPLPAAPNSQEYCEDVLGFTGPSTVPTVAKPSYSSDAEAVAACNAVAYFGTYTGIASDRGLGAYASWTSTLGNPQNFMVAGSQDVYAAHVS